MQCKDRGGEASWFWRMTGQERGWLAVGTVRGERVTYASFQQKQKQGKCSQTGRTTIASVHT